MRAAPEILSVRYQARRAGRAPGACAVGGAIAASLAVAVMGGSGWRWEPGRTPSPPSDARSKTYRTSVGQTSTVRLSTARW